MHCLEYICLVKWGGEEVCNKKWVKQRYAGRDKKLNKGEGLRDIDW